MKEKRKGDTELYIQWYFEELREAGYINEIILSPTPIQINRDEYPAHNVKISNTVYTPDLQVAWNGTTGFIWFNLMFNHNGSDFKKPFVVNNMSDRVGGSPFTTLLEVKPDVVSKFMTKSSSAISFPYRQKLVYFQTSLYVQLVRPIELFTETFTPQRYLKTNKLNSDFKKVKTRNELRTIKFPVRSLKEYLELTENITKPLTWIEKSGIRIIDDTDENEEL